MPSLPSLRAGEVITALAKAGFVVEREGKEHTILGRPGHRFKLAVPRHAKALKTGLLRSLVRASGLTVEEFLALL